MEKLQTVNSNGRMSINKHWSHVKPYIQLKLFWPFYAYWVTVFVHSVIGFSWFLPLVNFPVTYLVGAGWIGVSFYSLAKKIRSHDYKTAILYAPHFLAAVLLTKFCFTTAFLLTFRLDWYIPASVFVAAFMGSIVSLLVLREQILMRVVKGGFVGAVIGAWLVFTFFIWAPVCNALNPACENFIQFLNFVFSPLLSLF